ncbi:heterokaryon incompatibility protein-domain-containing protein [Tricladium varicosporioides]|nr:heterokaryon incompatibility protein-domain-containing protein [Hymenoscyphus varicosporioides]
MAQDEPSFHYDSLLQGRYVRLLMIEPPEADKPSSILRVSLVEQPLDTAEFDALSYVWGDQTQKFRIICNGQNHSIGQSLHEALTEYRRRGSTRGLWADAICINQACEAEKSSQVQMMGDIYGAACRTIIWLGQIQPHDMDGIAIAEMSYARRSREDDSTDGSDVSFDSFNCRSRGLPEVLVGNNPHPSWKSLYSILTHPWFSRIWVVQELLLSRDPVMWRGDRSVDTEAMLWMAGQISGRVDLIILRDFDDLPEFYANNIALCRSRYRTFGSLPIWISMAHNIAMEATHIIDRYFALAGICTGQPSDFVNYSKTLEEVATQVGLMTLLDTPDYPTPDGLDRLADRPSLRLRSQQVRIPSWIPDCLSKPLMGLPISRTYNTENLRHQQTSFPRPEFQVVTDDLEKEPKFPFANLKVRGASRRNHKSSYTTLLTIAVGSRTAN